jgi:hypothetical protein
MQEVKLDRRWLPDGWSGTADWIFWNADLGGFVLGDLKTIKGDGITWIEKDGAKREHLWQLSAYWHACTTPAYRWSRGSPSCTGRRIEAPPGDQGATAGQLPNQ